MGHYDEAIIDGLFNVKPGISDQAPNIRKGMMGCDVAQHFYIIAGSNEGEGTFFACKTSRSEVRYDVMVNRLGNDCEEITIRVEGDSVESYTLANQDDVDDLTVAMSDLMVGETYKVSIDKVISDKHVSVG